MTTDSNEPSGANCPVSVTVVCICSAAHLRRCLAALEHQEDAPDFDTIVAYDPHIPGIDAVAKDYPGVRMVCNEGQRTPLELASRAVRESTGDLILLTEDHCEPAPNWIRTMIDAQAEGRAVVGGRVEVLPDASPTDWAFYFVDFFRYAAPLPGGPMPTLTVCNVSYKRAQLEQILHLYETFFMETVVNDALKERFGELWMEPKSEVVMSRHASLRDAIYERYAFGRLFGCTRNGFTTKGKRLFYACASPVLPLMLAWRMTNAALRSKTLFRGFTRALGPLVLMIFAWSWGEWLGYVTNVLPGTLVVAPEIRAAKRQIEEGANG